MSLNQFKQNPFQKGCETAATAAAGCVTNNFLHGQSAQTAEQAGANRDDRRTIGGFAGTMPSMRRQRGQVQFVIDDRDINQPTGTTSAIGDYLSYNLITGITNRSTFAGLPTLAYLGAFWNYLPVDGQTFFVAPGGNAKLGPLQSEQTGSTMNFGARAREEIRVTNDVAVVAGATVERTSLDGSQQSFTYNPDGTIATIQERQRRPRYDEYRAGGGAALHAEPPMAIPRSRRNGLRHAAVHEPLRDARWPARQQHRLEVADQRRLRRRRRLDAGQRRHVERHRLLRVL